MELRLCFIREEYFKDHKNLKKILDSGNIDKQSKRTHLCIEINLDKNHYYIPLRNNLGDEVRKFGRIGHSIPSESRKNAGLDYRYALIVNESKYIEIQKDKKIPNSQYRRIKTDLEQIQREFGVYVKGYIKAAKKHRIEKEPLYRESSLVNYLDELNI